MLYVDIIGSYGYGVRYGGIVLGEENILGVIFFNVIFVYEVNEVYGDILFFF